MPPNRARGPVGSDTPSPDTKELCEQYFPTAQGYARGLWSRDASLRDRIDVSDALSAGNWGLWQEARQWDPQLGPFAPWMRRQVRWAIAEAAGGSALVPRSGMDRLWRLAEAEKSLTTELGRAPSHAEVAQALEIRIGDHHELLMLRNSAREASELSTDLDALLMGPGPEETAASELVAKALGAFGPLSGDQQVVMALHYIEDVPFTEIAQRLDRRPEAVSRLHTSAKHILAQHLRPEVAAEAA